MKGYIQKGGASVYEAAGRSRGDEIFKLPGGAEVDIIDSHGEFYAIKILGRGGVAYVYQLEVDLTPHEVAALDQDSPKPVADELAKGNVLSSRLRRGLALSTRRRWLHLLSSVRPFALLGALARSRNTVLRIPLPLAVAAVALLFAGGAFAVFVWPGGAETTTSVPVPVASSPYVSPCDQVRERALAGDRSAYAELRLLRCGTAE